MEGRHVSAKNINEVSYGLGYKAGMIEVARWLENNVMGAILKDGINFHQVLFDLKQGKLPKESK